MTSPCFKVGRYCIPIAENKKIQIARKKRADMMEGTAPMSVEIITWTTTGHNSVGNV